MLGGESGAGADLAFIAGGDGDGEAERDFDDVAWIDGDCFGCVVSWEAGGQVEACGELGLVLGDGGAVVEFHEADGGGGLASGGGGMDWCHAWRIGVQVRHGLPKTVKPWHPREFCTLGG